MRKPAITLTLFMFKDACEFLETICKSLLALQIFRFLRIKYQEIWSWHLEVSWSRYLTTSPANQIAAFWVRWREYIYIYLGTSKCHDHDILPLHQPIRLQHFEWGDENIYIYLGTSKCHDHDILPLHQPIRLQHFEWGDENILST